MKIHRKVWTQEIPLSIEEAWNYFSRPENLNEITPSDFRIELTKDISQVEIHKGMEIKYKMIPIFNIPIKWTTKITDFRKYEYLIYEQKNGPYALWEHEHYFEQIDGGIKMIDKLSYALKWGLIGEGLNRFIIKTRIDHIFEERKNKTKALFGTL